MARCICKSLLAKKQFDACDMVTAFLDEYKKDKCRGYGSGAMMLFERWDTEGYKTDPFLHSREQFSGKQKELMLKILIMKFSHNWSESKFQPLCCFELNI